MDKQTFEKEIYEALPNFGLSVYYAAWHYLRRDNLVKINPEARNIDHHLIEAASSGLSGWHSTIGVEVENVAPGFTDRLAGYLQLKTQLLHDLTKINKAISKDILLFREWLQDL